MRSRPYKPFVLHFHGTDIRTQFYDPARHEAIQWGADHAAAVLYSTPDLAAHARKARPDALYLANPVDPEQLPPWNPAQRQRVVFASRWETSKGGRRQLDLARSLVQALGDDVEFEGLDWGDGAAEAAAFGVRLVPRMAKERYLRWLAQAHCVVGQSAGILAMSELQAVAIGVPVAMSPLGRGFYPDPVPVLQGEAEALIEQIRWVLKDPRAASASLGGPSWVDAHHSPRQAVAQLADLYASVAAVHG